MTSDAEKTVFIAYRRSVSAYVARAIFEHLRAHGYDVFMDVESIDSGTFDTIILNQIEARAHFLPILTPGSVERCKEPGDWLRREIEFAMDKGRNVVPVLAHGFKFQDYEEYLTGKLSELPRYNGLPLYHEYFNEAMERLRTRFLKQPVTGLIKPTPPTEAAEVARKIEEVTSKAPPTEEQLTAEEYLDRGNTEYNESNYERALANYTEAIHLDPQSALAYTSRGAARHRQSDLDGAIQDYDQAIRLDPQLAAAYSNRGLAHYEQGDFDSAIADYSEAIRLDPQLATAYTSRGLARYEQDDFDGAIQDYDQAIRLDPQSALAYTSRGLARYKQDDFDGAIKDYEEAIRLDSQGATAYNNRGKAYFEQGQYEKALSDLEKADQLDSNKEIEQYVVSGLAITLHALGRVEEAKETWQSLITKDARYRDADWVGQELNMKPGLVAEARKLIAKL
jgi:tetratricopeptide (TPR) repeat protein